MSETLRSRIAPTPSGFLHLGNAFNFLLTARLTEEANGILRLRIDDLDAPRIRPAYLQDIFRTLEWLGIHWSEGPVNVADHEARYSQRYRMAGYNEWLQRLVTSGRVFACTCSRKEIASAQTQDGQYSGTCLQKHIPLDTPDVTWRVITPEGTLVRIDDGLAGLHVVDLYKSNRHFVVRRRDGIPAYHVASLADDVHYGINTIVRGADLLPSTAAQLFLAGVLNATLFLKARFYHHPLLTTGNGEKLSKSAGSTSLQAMIADGVTRVELLHDFDTWYYKIRAGV